MLQLRIVRCAQAERRRPQARSLTDPGPESLPREPVLHASGGYLCRPDWRRPAPMIAPAGRAHRRHVLDLDLNGDRAGLGERQGERKRAAPPPAAPSCRETSRAGRRAAACGRAGRNVDRVDLTHAHHVAVPDVRVQLGASRDVRGGADQGDRPLSPLLITREERRAGAGVRPSRAPMGPELSNRRPPCRRRRPVRPGRRPWAACGSIRPVVVCRSSCSSACVLSFFS